MTTQTTIQDLKAQIEVQKLQKELAALKGETSTSAPVKKATKRGAPLWFLALSIPTALVCIVGVGGLAIGAQSAIGNMGGSTMIYSR